MLSPLRRGEEPHALSRLRLPPDYHGRRRQVFQHVPRRTAASIPATPARRRAGRSRSARGSCARAFPGRDGSASLLRASDSPLVPEIMKMQIDRTKSCAGFLSEPVRPFCRRYHACGHLGQRDRPQGQISRRDRSSERRCVGDERSWLIRSHHIMVAGTGVRKRLALPDLPGPVCWSPTTTRRARQAALQRHELHGREEHQQGCFLLHQGGRSSA
jgi:hypothetical protein